LLAQKLQKAPRYVAMLDDNMNELTQYTDDQLLQNLKHLKYIEIFERGAYENEPNILTIIEQICGA
jgi:hypothetical protein